MNKHTFGEPGTGVHATRIAGFALWDIVGTIAIAWAISWGFSVSFWWTLLILFVLAEGLHWYFGVRTAFLSLVSA